MREVRLHTPVILQVVHTLLDEGVELVEGGSPDLSVTSVTRHSDDFYESHVTLAVPLLPVDPPK